MSDQGIVLKALNSLGKGFDLSSNFRLKFCKGDNRIIVLNETDTRQLSVPGFGSIDNVSIDIRCDKGDRTRYQSEMLDFNQMSAFFNQKCSVSGKIPSGQFNSMFGFQSGSWAIDAASTKSLAFDGYFIILFNIHIDRYPLILADEVRNAVPSTWDPSALARFIEKYGTHVIVGLSIGGHDVVLVKQDKSSSMEPSELKNHLYNLGDQLFNGTCTFSPHQLKTKEQKHKAPHAFNVFDPQPNILNSFESITAKDVGLIIIHRLSFMYMHIEMSIKKHCIDPGISVICSKRGGDSSVNTHCEWLPTVPLMPDAVHFNFIPITSLLRGLPGKGFLSHAINLYLRYKPPIADLEYFLDFQTHRIWAPIHNDLSMGPARNKSNRSPSLNFNIIGPKLYVNTSQVTVNNLPVTGMRLYLEGIKCNRLGVHLQHLTTPPVHFQTKFNGTVTWRGSEEIPDNHRYYEPIQWKKFSHICTAPVKPDIKWFSPSRDTSLVVTGAQLHVKKHDSINVLHLRLAYSKISNSCIMQSNWMHAASENNSIKSGFFSSISTSITGNVEKEKQEQVVVDSGVYPAGPPVPVQSQKLLKFVDMAHLCKGPLDSPGHWLVTGAKLDLEKGKICLRVKFSLLKMC
ncbi:MACPF domain-containing protein-like [Dorcoceras hygrometricum]|uniref:MACPF domain-containing protein-like n=1 Tax=Dorcoceras hygrometricum TaxID=472368 RepID=A0A2Z7ADV0_9LAMI|nr:MACPF domain-containing protein-like [Dorcoceras hygrometricum]